MSFLTTVDDAAILLMLQATTELTIFMYMALKDIRLAEYAILHPYAGIPRPVIPETIFDFDTYTDANSTEDFRFTCDEIKNLRVLLRIPDEFVTKNRDK